MTVYVVTSGSYEDWKIDGAFSTKEKAEEMIRNLPKSGYYYKPEINELDLDDWVPGTGWYELSKDKGAWRVTKFDPASPTVPVYKSEFIKKDWARLFDTSPERALQRVEEGCK